MSKPEIIKIDEIEYVRKDSIQNNTPAQKLDGMEYCIVRTYSAGVFAGYLAKEEGQEATVKKARRIWYWSGAASLSQLAVDGTSEPDNCKFPCAVDEVRLKQVIEIIPCTSKAAVSIQGVKVWKK